MAIACLTLAVLIGTLLPQWPLRIVTTPMTVLPARLRREVPTGDPVAITYPYATEYNAEPMLWQVDDDFGFRLLGGYAYHPIRPAIDPDNALPSVMNPPGLQQFLAGQQPLTLVGHSFPTGIYGSPLPVSPELVATTRTTLSRYHVRLVIVDRSVSGSGPVMELFSDALGPPRLSAGQFSLWTDWGGVPRHQVFPNLITSVLQPANGSTVSGTRVLDARATDYAKVTKVEFYLSGASLGPTLIGTGGQTLYGWIALWNTAGVPDGTYTLQSVAYDSAGRSSHSEAVTITVDN